MSNTARRQAITYPNGRVVNLSYGSSDGIDDLFSLVKSTEISGEIGNKVEYSRAGLGRFVKVAYPQPGVEMSMIRPGGGSEGDSGDHYDGYDRFGRVQEMRWQNTSTGTPIDAWQWGYNEGSNRTWKKNLVATSGQDEAYGYDGLYQVIRDAVGTLNTNRTAIGGIPGEEEDFTYDPTGNWLGYRKDANGSVVLDQSRSNNQDNQLTQIDGSSALLSYDRAGNATKTAPGTGGDWTKYYQPVWDAWNRIVEVKNESGTSVQKNAYDGLSRRITKEAASVVTHTYWSDRWKPLEERTGSATTAARSYLWGERPGHRDELILRDRDTNGDGTLDERLYATMDYFNGTAVLNTSGVVLERYAYSAFGVRRIMAADFSPRSTSSYAWELGFQGQFRDTETGWYNYGYRFYVPLLGRWINRDPIAEKGGANLFKFANNKPINRNDRFGLWTCEPCSDQCNVCFPNPGEKEQCLADCRNAKLSMKCSGGGRRNGRNGGNGSSASAVGLSYEQCCAICNVLAREEAFGTILAALMSSNTFGDRTLESLNSSFHSDLMCNFGEFDIDWFTDINATTPANPTLLGPAINYAIGKKLWRDLNRKNGINEITKPFETEGERNAVVQSLLRRNYSDIFTAQWLSDNGCDCSTCPPMTLPEPGSIPGSELLCR